MILAGNQCKVNTGDLKSFQKPRWRSATDFQIVNIKEKSDVTKFKFARLPGLLVIFGKNKMIKAPLPKICLLVPIDGEI